jgi:hypothetical protein
VKSVVWQVYLINFQMESLYLWDGRVLSRMGRESLYRARLKEPIDGRRHWPCVEHDPYTNRILQSFSLSFGEGIIDDEKQNGRGFDWQGVEEWCRAVSTTSSVAQMLCPKNRVKLESDRYNNGKLMD